MILVQGWAVGFTWGFGWGCFKEFKGKIISEEETCNSYTL
jgi:hypothetical protein